MIYAQFYDYKLDGKLDEAMGDRSVVIMDGRMSSRNIGQIAEAECRKPAAKRTFPCTIGARTYETEAEYREALHEWLNGN